MSSRLPGIQFVTPICPNHATMKHYLTIFSLLFLSVLSTFAAPAVYVDSAGDYIPPDPANGATVTWKSGSPDAVFGLTFGTNAFTSVQAAINAVDVNGTVRIADGTYLEGAQIEISKNVTLQGDGAAGTVLSGGSNGDTIPEPGEHRVIAITGSGTTVVINDLSIIDGMINEGRDGDNDGGGIHVASGASLTANHSIFEGNYAHRRGGAIHGEREAFLSLNHTIFSRNTAHTHAGGAVHCEDFGSLTVHHCDFLENTAGGADSLSWGGAISLNDDVAPASISDSNFSGNFGSRAGGAISSLAHLTVTRSTFTGNATLDDPLLDIYGGGGIYSYNRLTVTNCTFSGNSCFGIGGGAIQHIHGILTIRHSTLTGNFAKLRGGGIYYTSNNDSIIENSIVAGNTAESSNADIFNSTNKLDSQGVNFIGDPTGNSGFRAGTDLSFASTVTTLAELLDPTLADNGGPTPTHALVLGSPAINAGDNTSIPAGVTTDQRGDGFTRIFQGTVDIGAVEASLPIHIISATPSIGSGGLAPNQTVTLTFNQDILAAGSGNLLVRGADGLVLQMVPITSGAISGSALTFSLAADLPDSKVITLEIEDAAIVNAFGNTFGVSDTSLTFTTCFPVVHVDAAGDFAPPMPAPGDAVTWKPGTPEAVSGLIFGVNAFSSVREAVDKVCAGGTVSIANGTYLEGEEIPIGKSITLQGAGAADTVISGNNSHRVFDITSTTAMVAMEGLGVINGIANSSNGGGIRNAGTLNINHSAFTGNSTVGLDGGFGGAIYNTGTLHVSHSTFTGNFTKRPGGAISSSGEFNVSRSTFSGNSSEGDGGAISVEFGGAGTITDTTVSGNSAGSGGGIVISGRTSTLAVFNSTITGNTATQGGGGIDNSEGSASFVHCTITGNTAPAGTGSGIASRGEAPFLTTITACIIAGNTQSDVDLRFGSVNTFISGGHNLIGSGSAIGNFTATGDQTAISSPGLAPLDFNGGSTQTHALIPGSPAIDAGDNASVPAELTFDQRGVPRVIGTSVDIGAVEFLPALQSVANTANYSTGEDTQVSIADLIATITGGGGLPLTLLQVFDPDNFGSTAIIDGDFIIYTPRPGQSGTDTFGYMVTDGFQTITGSVQVLPSYVAPPTFTIDRLELHGDDTATIVATGVPGQFYYLESSEDLDEWDFLGDPVICPENGIMHFPDPGPLPETRFYRVVDPRQ